MEQLRNQKVKPIEGQPIAFLPDLMNCSLDSSLVTKMTRVTFAIQDTRPPADYIENIIRKFEGSANIPNEVAQKIFNTDGTINYTELNVILLAFGVQAVEPEPVVPVPPVEETPPPAE